MSTSFVPSKSPEGAFSYAAAASGKHSPKATTATPTHMNNSGAGTPNGTLLDITKAEAVEFSASLDTANTPKQKASSSSLSSGIATVDNGEPSSFSSSSDRKLPNDEGGSNSEKAYQSEGDQLDSSKQPTKVAEASRERLVPAPPPSVNIWHVRAEGFREAKAKMQPVATVPLHAATSKSASPKSTEKPVEAKNPERRRTGKQTDTCAWDTEKGRENSYDRKDVQKDGRDRKKSTDAGRANGYPPREDGNGRHGRPNRHATKSNSEKEATASDLPPSLGDATSWPTPETAQDEEKRERERLQAEKEKDKPAVSRSSGHTKFVPAPFTPKIIHTTPLPTKMGRGVRGGRGSSGRGGALSVSTGEGRPERPEKPEKALGANSVTQNSDDRERVGHRGFGYSTRGSYHSTPRGGRRTGSIGSSSQMKAESSMNSPQGKRDSQQSGTNKGAGACPENAVGPVSGTASQSGEARREEEEVAGKQSEHDDGAFVGQGVIPPQYVERSHSHNLSTANGQTYQRPDSSIHPDGYSQGRSERGSASSRGTFRGRGSPYNSQHHHPSHSSSIANQTYPPHNHTQYPSHNPSFRGYIRGRGAARGYHQQPYPAIMYPSQPYPPYPYFDYGLNPGVNSHVTNVPMSIVSVNTSNGSAHVMEEALAHRDYTQSKEIYSGLLREVAVQMEYYFSVDNLCKDIYLRRHMDSEGWVSLSLIAGFTMIQKHTRNLEILRDACQASPEIEIMLAQDGYRVRKAVNFKPFVLRSEERDPAVQRREFGQEIGLKKESTSDSSLSNDSGRSQMSAAAAPFQPSINQRQPPNELFSAQPIVNGVPPPTPVQFEPNGIERTYSQLSANAAEFSMPDGFTPTTPVVGLEHRLDSHFVVSEFPDDRIDDITIIYKKSLEEKAVDGLQALNGEILSIGNDDEDGTECSPLSPVTGDRPFRNGVSWTIDSQSGEANVRHSHESYTKLRGHALQKRLEGFPTSVKMTILYHFWSHFLMDHFNRKMYDEFKSFAMEDGLVTFEKSLEILFGFYESIHVTGFPSEKLSQDFVELAHKCIKNGTNLGILRLEATLQNPHVKPAVRDSLQHLNKLELCQYSRLDYN